MRHRRRAVRAADLGQRSAREPAGEARPLPPGQRNETGCGQGCTDRRRHRRPRTRVLPRPAGQDARCGLHVCPGLRSARQGGQGTRSHLRAYRPGKGPQRLRRPVLVLLLLQPVQRRARRRLGRNADHVPRPTLRSKPSPEGPSEIALFQHGGGEKGAWDADKVEKDGTHPIVYPASGSHATFFSSNLFIGNGQATGAGLRQHRGATAPDPRPTVADLRETGSQFQRLTYTGRWGQKEKSFNNGPQGPDDEDAMARALRVDGRGAPGQPDGARRRDPRAGHLERVLRARGQPLRVLQLRHEDDLGSDHPRSSSGRAGALLIVLYVGARSISARSEGQGQQVSSFVPLGSCTAATGRR